MGVSQTGDQDGDEKNLTKTRTTPKTMAIKLTTKITIEKGKSYNLNVGIQDGRNHKVLLRKFVDHRTIIFIFVCRPNL